MDSATDLPKSQVKRIVKAKLYELYSDEESHKRNLALGKDVLTAFAESGRVFITHVTAAANDVCSDAKRSTVTGDDILQALTNVQFGEFLEPLRSLLEEFRAEMKEKNRRKAASRQQKEAAAAQEAAAPEPVCPPASDEQSDPTPLPKEDTAAPDAT